MLGSQWPLGRKVPTIGREGSVISAVGGHLPFRAGEAWDAMRAPRQAENKPSDSAAPGSSKATEALKA